MKLILMIKKRPDMLRKIILLQREFIVFLLVSGCFFVIQYTCYGKFKRNNTTKYYKV